tara:strand:- start:64 stop:330 length:267 start_codon:yes stop_codon:yes gene_type:complete
MGGRVFKNKFPKGWIGKRVEVEWLDPAGYVQSELSKVKPCPCVTSGTLLRICPDYVVIASSLYSEKEADPTVDATAITRGCVIRITQG